MNQLSSLINFEMERTLVMKFNISRFFINATFKKIDTRILPKQQKYFDSFLHRLHNIFFVVQDKHKKPKIAKYNLFSVMVL